MSGALHFLMLKESEREMRQWMRDAGYDDDDGDGLEEPAEPPTRQRAAVATLRRHVGLAMVRAGSALARDAEPGRRSPAADCA